MKRIHLILIPILTLVIILASCKKEEKISHRILGIQDLTFRHETYGQVPEQQLLLDILRVDFSENLKLSLEGLPEGMHFNFSQIEGYPPFRSTLTLIDSGVTPGTYPVKLICKGQSSNDTPHIIILTIKPDPFIIPVLLGNYDCFHSRNNETFADSITTYPDSNSIQFTNFANKNVKVHAVADFKNKQLIIPQQNVGSYDFAGTGDLIYDYDLKLTRINISYTMMENADTVKGVITLYK